MANHEIIPKNFLIQEKHGERLIIPSFSVGNDCWQDWKLRWLRSLHLSRSDTIISAGWPKFMNLGEGVGKYHVDTNLLGKYNDLTATLKIDGTLLVRFVVDKEVRFRTRGSFSVAVPNSEELNEFFEKFPALIDPDFYPNDSLLFEWVSPANRIVIRYEKPDIFLIGGVRYSRDVWWQASPSLFSLDELQRVSCSSEVPLVSHYSLNNKSEIDRLIADLKTNTEIEGFVIRFDNSQQLVKLKSAHYFTLHALRSNLTTVRLIELWLQWHKPSWQDYKNLFTKNYDWECWNWALPAISAMYDGIKSAKAICAHVNKFVIENRYLPRKKFALEAQNRFNGFRLILGFLFLDQKEVPENIWKKLILQNCKQMEMRMFNSDEQNG